MKCRHSSFAWEDYTANLSPILLQRLLSRSLAPALPITTMAQQQHFKNSPSSGSNEGESDNRELFSAVLSTLDQEQLPLLASAILHRYQPHHPSTNPSVGEPLYGSYHVIFPLTFDTDVRWIAKIPINGTMNKWDELSASALTSEAKTMRVLKRETTIPLPEVLDFSSSTENPLQCPYIIMTFISGKPLYDVWFGHRLHNTSPETTSARRTRALEGIAAAMVQLDKFSFSTSGCPLFGNDGNLSGVGPFRRVDNRAMLDRWFIHNDPDDDPIYVECAASNDPRAYYTAMLDKHPEKGPFAKGLVNLLCQLISWIPEPSGVDPFVLTHPDFDIQNFIVSEDGELLGIIDWDGIAAMPRTLGNEKYPGWLTRDWDPDMYGYKESMENGVEPEGVWEDSPESLQHSRMVYHDILARYLAEQGRQNNLCRVSLITDNLAIAADDPPCRTAILAKMVHEIWAAAGLHEPAQPSLTTLADMFAEGNVSSDMMEILHRGFITVLSKNGL